MFNLPRKRAHCASTEMCVAGMLLFALFFFVVTQIFLYLGFAK